MSPFQTAFADIARYVYQACAVRIIWKDADPMQWKIWPKNLSQHRNSLCRALKRSTKRLAICCRADTTPPAFGGPHKRCCPFGVEEQVVRFQLSGRTIGWCYIGAWHANDPRLSPYPPAKAAAAAELTRRLVGGILHLYPRSSGQDNERLAWVCDYIEEHLQANLRASTVAKALGLSSSRFVHWFKDSSGETYSDYIQRRVLTHAAELLRVDSVPITAIAMQLGFPSPSYFSTAFKKYFGSPPSVWRRDIALQGE